MCPRKRSLAALLLAITWSCAPAQTRRAAPTPAPAEPVASTEALAFSAERAINGAEQSLEELHPDRAERQLVDAKKALDDPKIDGYPEAKQLRARYADLQRRLPEVREDVRRRTLAAAVEDAKGKVGAAREEMNVALAEVKKKHPDEPALKHAEESVEALKAAVEANTRLEDEDTGYASFALATRKEVGTSKKLVEQRRLEVAVADAREEIAHAVAVLTGALGQLRGREVPDEAFKEARGATEAVGAALAHGEPLVTRDIAFGRHVAQVKERLAADKALIEQRQFQVSVARQRARIEEGRRVLADALERAKRRDAGETEFGEADSAIRAIAAAVEEGAALAARDRDYASYATQVGLRLKEASAKVAARRLEVAVAQARKEIEGGRAALAEAIRGLKGGDPQPDAFAQARGAAQTVEKMVDDAKALAAKDAGFSRYAAEVRRSVQASRTAIERRQLEVDIAHQRAHVSEALAAAKHAVAAIASTDDVAAAQGAVAELDKAIEAGEKYGARDGGYSRFASEARKSAAAERTRIRVRSDQLAMEAQQAKVKAELEVVRGALSVIDGFSPTEDQFKAATDAVAGARKVVDAGVEIEKKAPRYRTFAAEARKQLHGADERIAKRKVEIAVRERRSLIEKAAGAARDGVASARKPDATPDGVQAAAAAVKALRMEIATGAALEAKDNRYATFATAERKRVERLEEDLDAARQVVAFRAGPVAAMSEGAALLEADAASPDDQQKAYGAALDRLRACQKGAATMLAEHRQLAAATFAAGRRKLKGASVATTCSELAKSAEGRLAVAKAKLAFYDGPAKSLEKARALLEEAQGSGDDGAKKKAYHQALASFESCLETGRLLEFKHPELKKTEFEVGGRKTTLPVVVSDCQKQAKSLRLTMYKK